MNDTEQHLMSMLNSTTQKTFYHNFPLMDSIVKSEEDLYVNTFGVKFKNTNNYFICPFPEECNPDSISVHPVPLDGYNNEVLENNYIYKIEDTLAIKNFRMNVKKFKNHYTDNEIDWRTPTINEMYKMLKSWYSTHFKEVYDFGYTSYMVKNFIRYQNLSPNFNVKGLYIDNEIVNLSIWTKLKHDTAVYIVCKSENGYNQFIGDYVRYLVYNSMNEAGYTFINDGSDLGLEGLKKYKTKFRPIRIESIYEVKR